MPKRPFEKGETVAVYAEGRRWVCQVERVADAEAAQKMGYANGALFVMEKGRGDWSRWVHPNQCRRLKPKPKPEQKPSLKRFRGTVRLGGAMNKVEIEQILDGTLYQGYTAEFIELPPGAFVLTEEKLERALRSVMSAGAYPSFAVWFSEVSKAVGKEVA